MKLNPDILAFLNWGLISPSIQMEMRNAGEVRSRSGYTSTLTVSLQQDGTTIKSWSVSGGGLRSVDESYTVEKGHSYQVIASVVVKDSNGTVVDRTSEESRVQSY